MFGIYGMHFSLFLFGSLLIKYRDFSYSSFWVLLIPLGLYLGALRPWHDLTLFLQRSFEYSDVTAFQVQIALNSIGGLLIVFSVVSSPLCHKVLTWKPFIYLGKISFSLYLVHLPILFSVGCLFYISADRVNLRYAAAFAATSTIVISLGVAYLLTITADRFSIYLSNNVARKFVLSLGVTEAPLSDVAHNDTMICSKLAA
jgi:peptidoglycan/LPS O-acetylase OafA/YrhL